MSRLKVRSRKFKDKRQKYKDKSENQAIGKRIKEKAPHLGGWGVKNTKVKSFHLFWLGGKNAKRQK
jgi:hypothetical protein